MSQRESHTMTNITFAGKTPAIYADKRVQPATFGPADYPVQALIQPVLDEQGLTLSDDYQGTSANPFLIEAFIAAIRANRLDAFAQVPYDPSLGRTRNIAERFGIDHKVMDRVFNGIYAPTEHMAEEDRRYYMVTMIMAAEAFNLTQEKITKAGPFIIVNAIQECKRNGLPVLFSGSKMSSLFHVHARLMQSFPNLRFTSMPGDRSNPDGIQTVYKTLGMLAAFTATEIDHLLQEIPPVKYPLVARVRVGFGCKDLNSTLGLINTTHERLLEDMLATV